MTETPGNHATPRQAHDLAQWRLAGAHVGTAHSVEEAEEIVWPMMYVNGSDA